MCYKGQGCFIIVLDPIKSCKLSNGVAIESAAKELWKAECCDFMESIIIHYM